MSNGSGFSCVCVRSARDPRECKRHTNLAANLWTLSSVSPCSLHSPVIPACRQISGSALPQWGDSQRQIDPSLTSWAERSPTSSTMMHWRRTVAQVRCCFMVKLCLPLGVHLWSWECLPCSSTGRLWRRACSLLPEWTGSCWLLSWHMQCLVRLYPMRRLW
jgi:hypothetical protein